MASPGENPKSERKKMIAAIALGVVALATLWYAFFGSAPKPASTPTGARPGPGTLPPNNPSAGTTGGTSPIIKPASLRTDESPLPPSPVPLDNNTPPAVPEASRNIFAYYVPPQPTPKPPPPTPPPTPAPTPPLTVTSVSPSNVYARTSDFKLDVTGDKFTPQMRIYIDGRELETRYVSPQQLSASVPASVIAYEGARTIQVRTPDGSLYSNQATISVAAPPAPNYIYVGLVGGPRYNDTAILKDKTSKNLVNIQRGDTVGGRFRVSSISQREVVLVDTTLRVKHTLPMTTEAGTSGGPQRMPQPPASNDDEPE